MSYFFETHDESDVETLFDGREYVKARFCYDAASNRIVAQLDPAALYRVTCRKNGRVLALVCCLGEVVARNCAAPEGVEVESGDPLSRIVGGAV